MKNRLPFLPDARKKWDCRSGKAGDMGGGFYAFQHSRPKMTSILGCAAKLRRSGLVPANGSICRSESDIYIPADVQQYAHGHHEHQEGGAARRNEGQGLTRGGRQARDHGDVDEHLPTEHD